MYCTPCVTQLSRKKEEEGRNGKGRKFGMLLTTIWLGMAGMHAARQLKKRKGQN